MKANGLNEVFFATMVLGLNGYFIGNVNGNEGKLTPLLTAYVCHIGLLLFKRARWIHFRVRFSPNMRNKNALRRRMRL